MRSLLTVKLVVTDYETFASHNWTIAQITRTLSLHPLHMNAVNSPAFLFSSRVHSLVRPAPRAFFRPTAKSRGRRAQGLSRLAAPSRPPAGLGLDWSEHGGMLDRIGAAGDPRPIRKFKPVILSEIHTAANTQRTVSLFLLR